MLDNATATAKSHQRAQPSRMRFTVFRLLETAAEDDTASRVVDIGLVALIGASVIAVVLESMPSFEARYNADNAMYTGQLDYVVLV